jgi:hypothetical protein
MTELPGRSRTVKRKYDGAGGEKPDGEETKRQRENQRRKAAEKSCGLSENGQKRKIVY